MEKQGVQEIAFSYSLREKVVILECLQCEDDRFTNVAKPRALGISRTGILASHGSLLEYDVVWLDVLSAGPDQHGSWQVKHYQS